MRWGALLIAAEAYAFAVVVYYAAFLAVRRRNAFRAFVSVRADIILLLFLGCGGAAIGVILFISHDWVQSGPELAWTQLFSPAHCAALGLKRCALHFAGGVGLLATSAILLATAAFEISYKNTRHAGSAAWRESLLTLSSDLGGDAKRLKPKKSARKGKVLSISDPFPSVDHLMRARKEGSEGALPLISTPSPCSTYPALPPIPLFGVELDTDVDKAFASDRFSHYAPPRPAPAPALSSMPSSIANSNSMSEFSAFPSSPSAGSVSTLATMPLFGLTPAVVAPNPRSSSLSPSPSQNRGGYSLSHSTSTASQHKQLKPPTTPGVDADTGRPKLSMEQIERKRLLLAQGKL